MKPIVTTDNSYPYTHFDTDFMYSVFTDVLLPSF